MNINTVVLVGRLTKDVKMTTFGEKNTPKAIMTVAVNRIGQEKTDYITVEAYGTQAENCGKYLIKGQEIAVVGSLHVENWEKEGQWYSRSYVAGRRIQFGSKPTKPSGNGNANEPADAGDYDLDPGDDVVPF